MCVCVHPCSAETIEAVYLCDIENPSVWIYIIYGVDFRIEVPALCGFEIFFPGDHSVIPLAHYTVAHTNYMTSKANKGLSVILLLLVYNPG